MVGRRVGMGKGWLIAQEPGSHNKGRLRVRQARGEEKVRHGHCDTDPLNDVVVALVVRMSVVHQDSNAHSRSDSWK